MRFDIMYKYQRTTLDLLEESIKILETKTEERKSFKIGFMRDTFLNMFGDKYVEFSGDLLIRINYNERYKLLDDFPKTFNKIDDNAFISIRSNVFLELNKLIDEIYTENHEREAFHEKLNKELQAIINSL